jgi:hypothetical protein
LKHSWRAAILITFACLALASLSTLAQAQKVDVAFGVSSVIAPSANADSPSLGGGAYVGFSGDVLFWHNLGAGAEIYWRANQSYFEATPYRPLYLDFNGVWAPKIGPHIRGELSAGIGAIDTRIYCGESCYNGYTDYSSDKHFMGDFGAAIKFYPKGNFFIRPEAKIYLIDNNQIFSSSYSTRVGASVGYTFGGH